MQPTSEPRDSTTKPVDGAQTDRFGVHIMSFLTANGLGYSVVTKIAGEPRCHEIVRTGSSRRARELRDYFRSIEAAASKDLALRAVAALLIARDHAARIAASSDEQGTAEYATKAHMRAWGQSIYDLAQRLLSSIEDLANEAHPSDPESTDALL